MHNGEWCSFCEYITEYNADRPSSLRSIIEIPYRRRWHPLAGKPGDVDVSTARQTDCAERIVRRTDGKEGRTSSTDIPLLG